MISETALISILGVAGMLLSGVLSFVLGQRSERKRQSLAVRAEMLQPIEDWLRGTERMIAILGDTLTSVMLNTPLPAMYDLEERRKAAQFMSERRNVVFGILQSKALQTGRVKKQSIELSQTILALDRLVKSQLLPLDSDILDQATIGALSQEYITQAGRLKLQLDSLVQKAFSLAARIKTALT